MEQQFAPNAQVNYNMLANAFVGDIERVKRKLISKPKFKWLMEKIATNPNPSVGDVALWLKQADWDDVHEVTSILFAEGEGMGQQQFGLVDSLKSGVNAVKNKLTEKESDEDFYKRSRESRGFAEGDGMDEKKPEQMADGEPMPEQMEGEVSSPVDQIIALLAGASEEVLAQILQLLQSAGSQSADGDVSKTMPTAFSAQFAQEVRKRKTIEEKLALGFELLSQRIGAIENRFEQEEALQFAAQTLEKEGVSQRAQIVDSLKGKSAQRIREDAKFAASIAGRDPKQMKSPKAQQTPEMQTLLSRYAGKETAVLQFAQQWETTSKMVPLEKFVRIQIEGYKPGKN